MEDPFNELRGLANQTQQAWLFDRLMEEAEALPYASDDARKWLWTKFYPKYADALTTEQARQIENVARSRLPYDEQTREQRGHASKMLGNRALNLIAEPLPPRGQGKTTPTPPPRPLEKVRPRGWVRKPPRNQRQKRRHVLAAGRRGVLIPALDCEDLTVTEKAVLVVIAEEIAEHGICNLCVKKIADLAGCCSRMVTYTLPEGEKLGLFTVERRPIPGRKSQTNLITPTKKLWGWLKNRKSWKNLNLQKVAGGSQNKSKKYGQEDLKEGGMGEGAAEGQRIDSVEVLPPEHRSSLRSARDSWRQDRWRKKQRKFEEVIVEARKTPRGGGKPG